VPTSIVQLSKISLAFGDRDIFKDINLFLSSESRSALAGINGSGKTTLMKIIAGKIPADSGEIAAKKGSRISYLPQAGMVPPLEGRRLWDEAESAYEPLAALLGKMEAIGRSLESARTDGGGTALLLEEYQRLGEAVEHSGYYNRNKSISMVLKGLGFSEKDFSRETGEFSGGWQMRISLAKVLLESPDLMLLDEPTNYLDIEARTWLENWLETFSGAYLLVSHDRYFLDRCVNEVYELFQGGLRRYAGNYSAYEAVRQQELESLVKSYAEQQEEIAKSEDLIRRFRYKASKAAMVQERIKRLEKMERIEIPESLKRVSISFPPPPRAGRVALSLRGLGKRYGTRQVFSGLDLTLDGGEKLVVAGRNGAGKSTLLRILAGGDAGYEGELRYGSGIIPAYFSQDSAETLRAKKDLSVLAFIEEAAPEGFSAAGKAGGSQRLRDMLGAFLFRGDDVYKTLSVLSGGEKSRLALLKLLLKPANLLILDEPTNHLELHSKDILLDALLRYTGTVIFVSHDRAFMEALSTKTLELRSGSGRDGAEAPSEIKLYYGGYSYYLEKIGEEEGGKDPGTLRGSSFRPAPAGASTGSSGDERRAEKQRQTLIRRLERQEADCLAELEALEAKKARLEEELARPEVYADGEKARAVKRGLDELCGEFEKKTAEWERIAGELLELVPKE
jgi:ATP-binding cassette subfamily F protein 3